MGGWWQRHTYVSCGFDTQVLSMKLLMSCGEWLQEMPPFLQLLYTWDLPLSSFRNIAENVRCHAERKSEVHMVDPVPIITGIYTNFPITHQFARLAVELKKFIIKPLLIQWLLFLYQVSSGHTFTASFILCHSYVSPR